MLKIYLSRKMYAVSCSRRKLFENYVEKYKQKVLASSPSKDLLSQLEVNHYVYLLILYFPVVCSNWKTNLTSAT